MVSTVVLWGAGVVFVCFVGVLLYVHRCLTFRDGVILHNKHVVITGATKGIGRALTNLLSTKNLRLTLLARTSDNLDELKSKLLSSAHCHSKIQTFVFDVTDEYVALEEVFDKIVTNFGPVDVLVNCAGGAYCGRFEDIPFSKHKAMLDLNYTGSAKMAHLVLNRVNTENPFHRQTTIVFLSSVAGKFGFYGFGAYSPSKFALDGLAQVLQMENKHKNVNIITVYPSDTKTPGYTQENLTKPPITKIISGKAELYEPEFVAMKIITAIEQQQSSVFYGLSGYVVNCATVGASSPPRQFFPFVIQLLVCGLARFILLTNMCNFYGQIRRHSK